MLISEAGNNGKKTYSINSQREARIQKPLANLSSVWETAVSVMQSGKIEASDLVCALQVP